MPAFKPLKVAAQELGVHWAWLRDRRLEGSFIEGVHYRKVPGFRAYCYNVPLVAAWIDVGGDPALHQHAIEEFLAKQNPKKKTQTGGLKDA